MSDHLETSATCDVCRRPIVPIADQPGEVECSDFCYRTTAAERLAFTEMRPVDFGCWPCSECGCIVEDEFPGLDGTCSDCAPTRRIRILESELERIRPVYEAACAERDRARELKTIDGKSSQAALRSWMSAHNTWLAAHVELRAAVDAARKP